MKTTVREDLIYNQYVRQGFGMGQTLKSGVLSYLRDSLFQNHAGAGRAAANLAGS